MLKIEGLKARKPPPLPSHNVFLIDGESGAGKGHAYGTLILTPDNGWVRVEDLEVGDDVVGSNGKPTKVYGVYDRGELPVYRVSFIDGASLLVDGDHLWRVTDHHSRTSTLSVKDIIHRYGEGDDFKPNMLEVPVAPAIEHPERELPLPPYMLGALLADGSLHGNSIQWTKNSQDVADTMSGAAASGGFEMREVTRSGGSARQWAFSHPNDTYHSSVLVGALRDLGLRVKSGEKFIPELYLHSSVRQRTELLNGLFDGDGRLYKKGYPVYHSTSRQLAYGVYSLLWSLGVAAWMSQTPRSDGTYRVSVRSAYNPFLAAEHRAVVATDRTFRRSISSIVEEGTAQVRCLAVTAPDKLYVAQGYVVTHNTTLVGTVGKGNKIITLDFEGGTVSYSSPSFRALDDATELDNIHVIPFPRFDIPPRDGEEEVKAITDINTLQLRVMSVFDYLRRTNNSDGYTLLAIDSLSEMQQRFITLFSGNDPRQGYQQWKNFLSELVNKAKVTPVNTVFISRPMSAVNEVTGEREVRSGVSPAAWQAVSGLIDANGYYQTKTNPAGRTTRTLNFTLAQRYSAKTRMALGVLEDPTFKQVLDLIAAGGKEEEDSQLTNQQGPKKPSMKKPSPFPKKK